MKIYLEAQEIVSVFEQAEFIRSDITGMTDTEVEAVKKAMQDIMSGTNYRLTRHTCRHDENKTCTAVEI